MRLLLRSYRPAQVSLVREVQIVVIVILSVSLWMAWAIQAVGIIYAALLTLPTSLPALLWLDGLGRWLLRKDARSERLQRGIE